MGRRRKSARRGEGLQRHVLADLWECSAARLSDEAGIRQAMLEAAERAGATVVDSTFHRFEGGGVTGVVAVRESHLTIHTWPERGYAAVDIFLCGRCDPYSALEHLTDRLGAARAAVHEERRGQGARAAAVGRSPRGSLLPLYVLTVVVALCSIVYELLLAQTLSALLGNTVLRYSVTIGCFLGALGVGALLCGERPAGAARRLTRVELALSVLGGVSVPLFYFLDVGRQFLYLSAPSGSSLELAAPLLFLAATHAVIIAIGLLSGFEVPLLLALGEEIRQRSTNRVLGVDYFGALLGSLLFPILFLRTFGLFTTAFAVALLNAVAALALVVWRLKGERLRFALAGGAVTAALVLGLASAGQIEQFFLKKLYYIEDVDGIASLFRPQPNRPAVVRRRSSYQTIDLVRQPSAEQWVWDAVSRKPEDAAAHPRDLWLYLDGEYQLFSGVDEIYHEWFVHAPIQARGAVPKRVLVLGGGDGLALREILKYGLVRRVVHVELDDVMIRLADEDPTLSRMNEHAHADPRVVVEQADAFSWLRESSERFDAVYIDMPYARDYNLSLVYSREFYAMVRDHLAAGAFVAVDTPAGWCHGFGDLWDVYDNTLRAAGFRTVVPLVSRVNLKAPHFQETLDAIVEHVRVVTTTDEGQETELSAAETREYLLDAAQEEVANTIQEFVLAFPEARAVRPTWRDFSVPLYAFGPAHLPLAFDQDCPHVDDPARVNSIFRPTLPPIDLPRIG